MTGMMSAKSSRSARLRRHGPPSSSRGRARRCRPSRAVSPKTPTIRCIVSFGAPRPSDSKFLDRLRGDEIALADDHLILQHRHLHVGHGGDRLLLPRARLGGILRHIRDDIGAGEVEGDAALRRAQCIGARHIHLQLGGGLAAGRNLPVGQRRAQRLPRGILHPQPRGVIEPEEGIDIVGGQAGRARRASRGRGTAWGRASDRASHSPPP